MWRETHRWRGFPSTLSFTIATGVPGIVAGDTSYTLNCVSRIGLGCLVAALFPFAVAKGAQPNRGHHLRGCRAQAVSIRCREGRTAERGDLHCVVPEHRGFLFAVAKGVQRNLPTVPRTGSGRRARFYSLSRRAYSGTTADARRRRAPVVSIRCHEGRTAEPVGRAVAGGVRLCFYSLSRRAYSGTSAHHAQERSRASAFLFAVAKGVQRNAGKYVDAPESEWFLFAVAKGVQRNRSSRPAPRPPPRFYSLSRRAYSGTTGA